MKAKLQESSTMEKSRRQDKTQKKGAEKRHQLPRTTIKTKEKKGTEVLKSRKEIRINSRGGEGRGQQEGEH